jgi:hypothetical protein
MSKLGFIPGFPSTCPMPEVNRFEPPTTPDVEREPCRVCRGTGKIQCSLHLEPEHYHPCICVKARERRKGARNA